MRGGKVINTNEFIFDQGKDVPFEDLVRMFILRYYDKTSSIPHEVILEMLPEDSTVIEEWLTEKLASPYGAKVNFIVPKRGERSALLQKWRTQTRAMCSCATKHAATMTMSASMQHCSSSKARSRSIGRPLRIECFDISTIHGKHSVASMVVFVNGKPDKSQYRRFKIRLRRPMKQTISP